MAYGLNTLSALVWTWGHSTSRSITSRKMIRSAPSPNCAIPRLCRGTIGKFGSRRSCGFHARVTRSCCRAVCALGRAPTKCVVANGIAPFPEISYERSGVMINDINNELILAARLSSRDPISDFRLEKAEGLFGHGKSNSGAWRSDASAGCCRCDLHGASGRVSGCYWCVHAYFRFTFGSLHAGNCAYCTSLLDTNRPG
jgi:hypothetical protein